MAVFVADTILGSGCLGAAAAAEASAVAAVAAAATGEESVGFRANCFFFTGEIIRAPDNPPVGVRKTIGAPLEHFPVFERVVGDIPRPSPTPPGELLWV